MTIDLNDLVEKEIYPFWTLTLKRILDAAEKSGLKQTTLKELESLFLNSIQSKNLFLTIDSVRSSVNKLIDAGFTPTLFFIRFDRMQSCATQEFFSNLEGLRYATHNNLNFVFTTYRSLNELSPTVYNLSPLSIASNETYLIPANFEDLKIIYDAYNKKYQINLEKSIAEELLNLTGGYVQYLQLGLITLQSQTKQIKTKEDLVTLLSEDERINLQSEELWESLTDFEQEVGVKIAKNWYVNEEERNKAKYLWVTGLIKDETNKPRFFSPVFLEFVSKKISKKGLNGSIELTKKEHLLYSYLKDNLDQICERENIINAVWPEEEGIGVSDWAIDRLVARLRKKLLAQKENFEIVTVKTRGFKLIERS